MIKTKKQMFTIISAYFLLIFVGGVTYAFFNYTRTGSSNTIRVGKISFTTGQTNTINLTNVFPITREAAATDIENTGEVIISITGETTYENGLEYVVSLEDVNIKTSGNKNIPIGIIVTPEKTGELGTANANYFDYGERGGYTSYYKVLANEVAKNGDYILVGYIRPGTAEVNGTIGIKAFIDKDKILISDTYDGSESDNMGTPRSLANGKVVITTSEWNALQTAGVSFKVKVQANEGIWVGEPTTRNDLDSFGLANSTSFTQEQKALATEVNFIKMSEEMINTHANLIDLTQFEGNGVVKGWFEGTKLYIASPGEIYFPADSVGLFSDFSNVTKYNFDNINTSLVQNMTGMFANNTELEYLDLSGFDTSSLTDMESAFHECTSLINIDFTGFDTSNVTIMNNLFYDCSSLTSLDLSGFDTSKVTRMYSMFYGCISLRSLNISSFDTSKVSRFDEMFSGCSSLTSLDLSNFNTINVTIMDSMFYRCSSLTNLDISNFNTTSVNIMSGMFASCDSLTTLDLSSFDMTSVTVTPGMFDQSANLVTIYVGNGWNTSNITVSNQMFTGCTSLVGGSGTTFDSNYTDKTYARVDGGQSNPGYLTLKTA